LPYTQAQRAGRSLGFTGGGGGRVASAAGGDDNPSLYVLKKLIENKDFVPQLNKGRMWFRSLRAENEVMNRIGWSRADDVHWFDEVSGSPSAWEKNIRYWQRLASHRTSPDMNARFPMSRRVTVEQTTSFHHRKVLISVILVALH
jgi:hypothetical protein